MSEQIQKIGNYILLEKLASGGMAEVYLAKMTTSDKLVAIKKVLPNHADTPEYRKLFKEEVKVSLNLKHGNIVGFIDCIQENDRLYLVMEFVNGLNLKRLTGDLKFKKANLSLAQCLYIVSEVASGLDYAHRSVDSLTNKKLNIIHRDINPHNIMITFDGCVKIIDFGIAKADSRDDVTKVGTIKGKFSYMSPEQASAKTVDSRCDIYALGIVLWELLLGRRMREGKNDLETLKRIRSAEIRPPREIDERIPVEIEKIVMKALEKDPEKRYQKASDLKFELDQYLRIHFSEFRPADFTDYISGMYKELIKSRIEKLVYFSKVKIESSAFSVPAASAPGQSNSVRNGTSLTIELPEGFESRQGSKKDELINFDKLKKENPFAADVKVFSKQKAANFSSGSQQIQTDENTKKSYNFFENSFLANFKHLALMIIVIYAAYSFYNQHLVINLGRISNSVDQSSIAQTGSSQDVTESHAETEPYPMPPKRDDFSSYVYKKLKESAKLSYVNIYIENSRATDVKIFVDGKLLLEKPPIQNVPIYAYKITTITAYNERLNLYDERKVKVSATRTVDVKLSLKPYKKSD